MKRSSVNEKMAVLLSELQRLIEIVEKQRALCDEHLVVLKRAVEVIEANTGRKPKVVKSSLTVSDHVADLIACHGELDIDTLVDMLARLDSPRRITRKNLANTLNRWISRGRRFRRVRPNTFALISLCMACLV
jgi:hypothetical protein